MMSDCKPFLVATPIHSKTEYAVTLFSLKCLGGS